MGGKGRGGPKFLGRSRGRSGGITSLMCPSSGIKFQIPDRDSSPLGVSCIRWAFPACSALGLVLFFGPWRGLEHPKPIPGCRRIFGISVPFFLQLHRAWRPSLNPPTVIPCLPHCWQLQGNTNPINPIPNNSGMVPAGNAVDGREEKPNTPGLAGIHPKNAGMEGKSSGSFTPKLLLQSPCPQEWIWDPSPSLAPQNSHGKLILES